MLKSKFSMFYISFFLFLFLAGCTSDQQQKRQILLQKWMLDNGKIKVLSTTGMIDDIVKQIGGEHIDTMTLIQGQLDPHSYQLVKGDDEKLSFAKIIFYNGLGLEHGPSLQHYLIDNPKAIALGDQIEAQNPAFVIEVEGQKDPHIWMDISIWKTIIPFIVETLIQQDPSHAADYLANGKNLEQEMQNMHAQVKEKMQEVPSSQRFLVTSHDAFNYFARAYLAEPEEEDTQEWEKRFAAPEGLAPESQLSTSHIKAIIDHLKRYQIELIFPESNVNRDSIKKIVQAGKEQGLNVNIACCVLYSDAMGEPGTEADTYLKMMLYNAKTLSEHMRSPSQPPASHQVTNGK